MTRLNIQSRARQQADAAISSRGVGQAILPAAAFQAANAALYYYPSVSSRAATIFQRRGAGNSACSRLSGGSWLRLCPVGQLCKLRADWIGAL